MIHVYFWDDEDSVFFDKKLPARLAYRRQRTVQNFIFAAPGHRSLRRRLEASPWPLGVASPKISTSLNREKMTLSSA